MSIMYIILIMELIFIAFCWYDVKSKSMSYTGRANLSSSIVRQHDILGATHTHEYCTRTHAYCTVMNTLHCSDITCIMCIMGIIVTCI